MIRCTDVSVAYGDTIAVEGLNLNIKKNTIYGIIGKSGCGKTSLLYALAGLIVISGGTIEIEGEKVRSTRKDTGLILQNHGLFPWKNVWENASLGLKIRKEEKETMTENVESLLKKLGIYQYKDRYIHEISGGQKQRVSIVRSLATKPDLLLMDEPTASLDAISKEDFQSLILDIYKSYDLTVVFVTHDIEEAVYLGEKIVVMEDGGIKEIVDNTLFNKSISRSDINFYKMCLKVREALGEKNG
jgi:NitT/TauT family transport system ATP-binding protein